VRRRSAGVAVFAAGLCAAVCGPPPREYELRGVVVSVDAARHEITIQHEDIPRFMPGMTMPFKVRDGGMLAARAPGDVVRATLVVEGSTAHLKDIVRTGSAPVPALPSRPREALESGAEVPDAMFVDQDGRSRRLSEWRGRAIAVTFTYPRCPIDNFCPLMDRHFAKVQEAVREDPALRGRVRLVSVSIDPAFDRPDVLAAHARRMGADPSIWSFVTGDPRDVERFASAAGVSSVQGGEGAQIVHNLRTAVVDPNGRLAVILRGNEWTPGELVSEVKKALGR